MFSTPKNVELFAAPMLSWAHVGRRAKKGAASTVDNEGSEKEGTERDSPSSFHAGGRVAGLRGRGQSKGQENNLTAVRLM